MSLRLASAGFGAALLLAAPAIVSSQPASLKYADSFRIGSGGVLCTAQSRVADPALKSMFDRAYAVVCRDAATSVGKLYVLKGDARARLLAARADGVTCVAPAAATLAEIGAVERARCTAGDSKLAYSLALLVRDNQTYAVEGLAGYQSALDLALKSAVLDRPVTGDVEVSATGAGDPAAFARVQAGSLDIEQTLVEAYGRNNSANYAEAAVFFDTLVERGAGNNAARSAEYLANDALQQSNLGNFVEAEALFRRAGSAVDASDALQTRMLRNFRTIHRLNRGDPKGALRELDAPAPALGEGLARARVAQGFIDRPIAQRLNTDDEAIARLSGVDSRLTPGEKAQMLDAQALYLRGAALRATGRLSEAKTALNGALAAFAAVRGGRVTSSAWLRAASLTELSAIAEREGRAAEARSDLDQAVELYRIQYPGSAALLASQARVAALLARQGQGDAAIAMYRDIVRSSQETEGAAQAVRSLMAPYFALLASSSRPEASADFFEASQILPRPGVAQTQAVLARELSGGDDKAAALFRQSVTLSRDIVRLDAEIGRLSTLAEPSSDDSNALVAARAQREQFRRDQTAVLAQLSDFPRYRVVASDIMPLAELQAKLRPGEAYYKLVLVGDRAFGVFATAKTTRLFPVGMSVPTMGTTVATIRDTIVKIVNDVPTTSVFDAKDARKLYVALFGPVDAEMAGVTHLVFEPDGPMLQLPVNLLIADQASADAFMARSADPNADAFDMRGVGWLGRTRMVSTAVSPRAFADVRAIAPSSARKAYLGLGENAPPAVPPANINFADPCVWPIEGWSHPISAAELRTAASKFAGQGTELITDAAFSDTALEGRTDLNQYRVLHFATHGLVTAPRPECPARPALVTSFGGPSSDGLLTFREIFDLRLDADTVILSACDTAGMATIAATREAGIETGGNFALDGLVRAFVGAGSRTVIASHWPVPDEYNATQRLISGLFAAIKDQPVGESMRKSSVALMDDKDTSHPYYWSAFAIVGDGARALQ